MPLLAEARFADRFAVEQTALARSFRGRCSEREPAMSLRSCCTA